MTIRNLGYSPDEIENHLGEYAMSCYFRHLKDILEEADIEVTPDNRKQVDRAIHQIVGVTYKDCPET